MGDSARSRARAALKAALPAPVARTANLLRVRHERRGLRDHVVRHRYGGHEFAISIGSRYGERYDRDWPELAEIKLLARGALRPGGQVFNLGANHG